MPRLITETSKTDIEQGRPPISIVPAPLTSVEKCSMVVLTALRDTNSLVWQLPLVGICTIGFMARLNHDHQGQLMIFAGLTAIVIGVMKEAAPCLLFPLEHRDILVRS